MQATDIQPYLVANDVDASHAFYNALGFETVRDETYPIVLPKSEIRT
jgi:catechol 2,3-dioxygenase-like lactoylglutathione lyase family enzyme